ncbi:acyl-CoA thioesterase [Roseimaritima ulvae]|uniref:Acyl-ACP thioesterase n=1 Tax=Roseimaritima ulvae TaxID=980254 RepID=A0A5B9QKF3_9BACT|nr:acyl-CoA thioesterase [Roseimaritima ulvae]QEG39587.1 Acyl-ACP thioesterase [Roseimaritima ulvae]
MTASHGPQVFDFHYTVSEDEIDAQEHVHNLRYLQWTLWAAQRHTSACGWDSKQALEQNGIGWVVRSHDVTYRAAAFAGDEIIVRTWIADVTHVSSRRRYLVCRPADRTILCRAETRWAFVDLNVRKAIQIPPELLQAIQPLEGSPGVPWDAATP